MNPEMMENKNSESPEGTEHSMVSRFLPFEGISVGSFGAFCYVIYM